MSHPIDQQHTVVFIPSYCLTRDGSRLTVMSEVATKKGAELIKAGRARHVIISAAYSSWFSEARLKKGILITAGVDPKEISLVSEITNSYDEADKVREIVNRLGIKHLIIVADKWHSPRSVRVFRRKFPNLEVTAHPFTTPKFEMALEPSRVKSIRAGSLVLWVVWNCLLRIVDPESVQKRIDSMFYE